jgi:MarR family transcriptional regulator, organic hydroperoxide resistance regulator
MATDEGPTTGSLVWQLAMRWRTKVDRAVAPFGLTHAQYSALASLWAMTRKGHAPSQRDLADYTGLGPIYVSKLVRSLAANGLVARQSDRTDTRVVRLTLTDHGADTVRHAMAVVRDLDRELTASFGGPQSAEIRALVATLQALLDETRERPETGDTP